MISDFAKAVRGSLAAAERLRSRKLLDHEERVGRLCGVLGGLLGLEAGHVEVLAFTASLHDIGKLVIPESVLSKPGRLDEEEWRIMRRHSAFGAEILRESGDPVGMLAADIALQHHECWDGSGYPDGLRGTGILREARIAGICDVYDAIREERPYKAPVCHEQAMRLILEGDANGRTLPAKFDPELLGVFAAHSEVFRRTYEAGRS
ncbi:HD domain-containing protein [Roseomonas sp. SSH11]|uniref:HD domain-containing protein n=1 Tax=Pararoseomonas baculiformis TaxID=2820812 RepID=A0ABS4ADZ7_9PROT|nr:HD domain-containing phosphohydrolase [Pararoseomonas baculiformis]MBP0445228.1 HD domain-containing protein [Pararoseomonas baculiformis]